MPAEACEKIDFGALTQQAARLERRLCAADEAGAMQCAEAMLACVTLAQGAGREEGLAVCGEIIAACRQAAASQKLPCDVEPAHWALNACDRFDDMRQCVTDCIAQLCQAMADKMNQRQGGNTLTEEIIGYINQNYQNSTLSLSQLSQAFSLSESHLSRLIKEQLGVNFIEYVNRKRIEQACHYLADPTVLVKNIATLVGYDGDKNFRRVFKKYEAMTPGEYRAMKLTA